METPTTRPPASITLADGKARTLLFSMAACRAIKKGYGVSIMLDGTRKIFESIDEDKLPKLLALGMDHEYGGEPGITEGKVAALLTAENSLEALKQLDAAFGRSLIKNVLHYMDLIMKMGEERAAKEAAAKEAAAKKPEETPGETPSQPTVM